MPTQKTDPPTLRHVDLANAFEHDLSLYEWEDVDDKIPADLKSRLSKHDVLDYLVLVDAELDFVALVRRDAARVLVKLLNWTYHNYPFQEED